MSYSINQIKDFRLSILIYTLSMLTKKYQKILELLFIFFFEIVAYKNKKIYLYDLWRFNKDLFSF